MNKYRFRLRANPSYFIVGSAPKLASDAIEQALGEQLVRLVVQPSTDQRIPGSHDLEIHVAHQHHQVALLVIENTLANLGFTFAEAEISHLVTAETETAVAGMLGCAGVGGY